MKVIYSKHYNIDLGLLNYLHPFDGTKFKTIYDGLKKNEKLEFIEPSDAAGMDIIDEFLSSVMRHRVRNKNGIFRALEVPRIPLIGFSFLDRKILTPMRWGGRRNDAWGDSSITKWRHILEYIRRIPSCHATKHGRLLYL